jgi:hypothetical protein
MVVPGSPGVHSLARPGEERSTNPRDDLARSIEDLKMAVDVLNAIVVAKFSQKTGPAPADDSPESTATGHAPPVVGAGHSTT